MNRNIVLIIVMVIMGCSGDRAPTSVCPPTSLQGEIVAWFEIDSCFVYGLPPSATLDSLCGRSTLLSITFEYVYPDRLNEIVVQGLLVRNRQVKTRPTSWEFTNASVASALLPLFSDSALTFTAYRVTGEGYDSRGMMVSPACICGGNSYQMILTGPHVMSVDPDGFPLIENNVAWSGTFTFEHIYGLNIEIATGSAEMSIKNLREVPVDTTFEGSN
jgi:hypothetical protein